MVEADDEGDEVERQGQHPQEGQAGGAADQRRADEVVGHEGHDEAGDADFERRFAELLDMKREVSEDVDRAVAEDVVRECLRARLTNVTGDEIMNELKLQKKII